MPLELLDLPSELLLLVLSDLSVLDLISCKQACKAFLRTIDSETILKYHIELGVAGLVENNIGHLTVTERFERLKAHLQAWDNLYPTRHEQCILPLNTGSTYELYGGLFARGMSSNVRGTTDALHLTALPSNTDRRGLRSSVLPLGVETNDFTMMPEVDLVVLVESRPANDLSNNFTVHLSTLSAPCRPHPEAKVPALLHSCVDRRPGPLTHQSRFMYLMQVCGDMLGVLFLPHTHTRDYVEKWVTEELVIWNWRTGTLVATYTSDSTPPGTFSFLSPSVLMTSSVRNEPAMDVFSLPSSSGLEEPKLQHRATFLLPSLRLSNVEITSVLSRSDPSPSVVSNSYGEIAPVFVPAPQARLITLALTLEAPIDTLSDLTLFVLLETLLEPLSVGNASREPTVIAWSQWHGKARLVDMRHDPDGHVCYVYGYRFITSSHVQPTTAFAGPPKTRIHVIDFNPLAARRSSTKLAIRDAAREATGRIRIENRGNIAEDFAESVITRQFRINAQHVFVDDVYSGLWMVVRQMVVEGRVRALMLDGERIIGLKTLPSGRERLDIMVF